MYLFISIWYLSICDFFSCFPYFSSQVVFLYTKYHGIFFSLDVVFTLSIACARMERDCSRCNNMMTSSNGNIFRVTGHLCGEFTGPGEFLTQRPVTRSFDVFFDLRLNKRLSKQTWGWWFETSSWSLWRQCNNVWSIQSPYKLSRWLGKLICVSKLGHHWFK